MIAPELVQKEAKNREKTIPVDVPIDSFYSDVNMVALRESIEQMKSGKVVVKSLEELEAMADE